MSWRPFIDEYLRAISEGADMRRFYHPEVVQTEYPNRLLPNGFTRDLQGLLDAAVKGKGVMRSQILELRNLVESGDSAALQLLWTGTLAVPIGTLLAGDEMRAFFAVFLRFKDGLIVEQHNYDCFEPF